MSGAADVVSKKVRGAVRRLADAAYVGQAGLAGFHLRNAHTVRTYELLRDLERRFGLTVRTVLYVGANVGQEIPLLLHAYPAAIIHCFEPQRECLAALTGIARLWPDRVRVHPLALSDREGSAVLHRPARHDQASSLLAPSDEMSRRFPHVTDWQDEVVSMTTLDRWASEYGLVDDVLVKMDVQGAEGLVLAGGRRTFERARLVICELAVVPTYEQAPDMRVIFDKLQALNYGYAGEIQQVRDTQGVVVEFDGAFVRLPAESCDRDPGR